MMENTQRKLGITPGPWRPGHVVNDGHSCNCTYIFGNADQEGAVAKFYYGKDGDQFKGEYPTLEECKANLVLACAALELYEALERARAILSDLARPSANASIAHVWAQCVEVELLARKALSRANGGEYDDGR